MPSPADDRRSRGPRALGVSVDRLTRPVFGRRGLAAGAIVTEWATIVGPHLATQTLPERIAFPRGDRQGGVLHLRVASGGLALELQHLAPLVIERVNGYFGYPAVSELRLVRGRLPDRPPAPRATQRPLTASEEQSLTDLLSSVDDPDLRLALEGLGRAVLGRSADHEGKQKK